MRRFCPARSGNIFYELTGKGRHPLFHFTIAHSNFFNHGNFEKFYQPANALRGRRDHWYFASIDYNRRRFNRRSSTGQQKFKSYFSAVLISFIEKLFILVANLIILGGVIIFLTGK